MIVQRLFTLVQLALASSEVRNVLASVEDACDALASMPSGATLPGLEDASGARCGAWAAAGECRENSEWMHAQCQLSCMRRLCMDADFTWEGSETTSSVAVDATGQHRQLQAGSGWGDLLARADMDACEAPHAERGEERRRLLEETWQSGIPVDAGCALVDSPVVHELADASTLPSVGGATTHLSMDMTCFSRALRRDALARVRDDGAALRCIGTFRRPIELRLLNGTGFALMCHAPLPTGGSLFVYAKAAEVTMRRVWPNAVPLCDRTDVE